MGDEYGPSLPPGFGTSSHDAESSKKSVSRDRPNNYGPSLPPGLGSSSCNTESSDKVIGPVLPSGLCSSSNDNSNYEKTHYSDSEEEDEEVVGPMLIEASKDGGLLSVAEEFEQRSKQMKAHLTNQSEPNEGPAKRDTWMTELPPEISKNFGLENRSFRTGKGAARSAEEGGDRSIWTDTPESRKEKEKGGKSKKRKREEGHQTSVRDQQLQKQVDDYNETKRPNSLLEMHSKKQKKKMKKEKKKEKKEKKARKERGEKEQKIARRPFDRDNDLQVNKFDDAQRKLMIQKSQILNTRFSKGATTSQFL